MPATVEPPKTETPTQPVEKSAKEIKSLLSDVKVVFPNQMNTPEPEQKPDSTPEPEKKEVVEEPEKKPETTTPETEKTVEPEKKEEPKAPETKPEEVKPEEKKDETPIKSETARQNFKRLEDDRNAQRARAEKAETELKTLQEKASKGSEYESRVQQLEKELNEARIELRAASIERDPAFVQKYDKGREARRNAMKALAATLDADTAAQFDTALARGDDEALENIREALTPSQRIAWDAHRIAIQNLEFERAEAVKNSSKTYQELQEQRRKGYEAQYEARQKENLQTADEVHEWIFTSLPDNEITAGIKGNEEVRTYIRNLLRGVAGGEGAERWTPKEIMKEIGAAHVQAQFLHAQRAALEASAKEIETKDAEIEKLKKDVEEKDAFIAKMSGGVPRGDATTSTPAPEKKGSLLDGLRVIIPGQ